LVDTRKQSVNQGVGRKWSNGVVDKDRVHLAGVDFRGEGAKAGKFR